MKNKFILNEMKIIIIFIIFVVSAYFIVNYFSYENKIPYESDKLVEDEGVFKIKIPFELINLKKLKKTPLDLQEKDFISYSFPFSREDYMKIKKNLNQLYLPENSGEWYYQSYKEWINQTNQKIRPDFTLEIKVEKNSIIDNPFNPTSKDMLSLFVNIAKSLYVTPKLDKNEKIDNDPIFLPIKIQKTHSGDAIVIGNKTFISNVKNNNKIVVGNMTYLFFNKKRTVQINFEYASKINDESKYRNMINSIIDSLRLSKDYEGHVKIID